MLISHPYVITYPNIPVFWGETSEQAAQTGDFLVSATKQPKLLDFYFYMQRETAFMKEIIPQINEHFI